MRDVRRKSKCQKKKEKLKREVGWWAGLSFSPHQAHTWSMMGGWEEEYFTVSRKAAWSFISFLLSQYIFTSLSTVSFPFCLLYNDNLIILYKAWACRGGELSSQPIYRALPTDAERNSTTEKVQKIDKMLEPASFSRSSLTHAHTLLRTRSHTRAAPLHLNLFYCGPVSAVSSH